MTEISEVWHISEPQAKQAIQQLHKETNQNNLLAQLDQTSQKEFLDLNTNIKTELSKELQQFFTSLDRSELIAVGLQLFEYNTMTENLQKSLIYTTFLQTLIVDILGKDAVGTFGIDARQGAVTTAALQKIQNIIDPKHTITKADGVFGQQSFLALKLRKSAPEPVINQKNPVEKFIAPKQSNPEVLAQGYSISDKMLSPEEQAAGLVTLTNGRTTTIEQFNGKAKYKNPSPVVDNPKTFDCISFAHYICKNQFGLTTPLPSEYHNIFNKTCGGKLSGYAEAAKSSKDKQDHLHLNDVHIGDFRSPAIMLEHRDTRHIKSDDGYIDGKFSGNHGGMVSGLIKNPAGEIVDVLITHATSVRLQGPVTVRLFGAHEDGYYYKGKHGKKPQVFARHPGLETADVA